ncbi:MAG: ferrochelatase, partial [Acidimicrobiales bacterium]
MTSQPYDAVLLLSFGGPERPDDVMPFLRNVTRGRNVPDDRLAVVATQYERFGGRSPINDQCRALLRALGDELEGTSSQLPLYWGNRNWEPYLADTVAEMAADGVERALVFVTSAFGSYSGCRQYRQDLEQAREKVGSDAPVLQKLRLYYNHPGFIEPMADNLRRAMTTGGPSGPSNAGASAHRVVFTAHSIPESMAAACSYQAQLQEATGLTMAAAGLEGRPYDLVFQSRSGPPSMPWLEPDVNDHLAELHGRGVGGVAVVPIGFTSDHMEVMFDLDTQAAATAAELGLDFVRVPTVGTAPRFVAMIRELIEEQLHAAPKLHLGSDGPWPDDCPANHCIPAPEPATGRPPSGRG